MTGSPMVVPRVISCVWPVGSRARCSLATRPAPPTSEHATPTDASLPETGSSALVGHVWPVGLSEEGGSGASACVARIRTAIGTTSDDQAIAYMRPAEGGSQA